MKLLLLAALVGVVFLSACKQKSQAIVSPLPRRDQYFMTFKGWQQGANPDEIEYWWCGRNLGKGKEGRNGVVDEIKNMTSHEELHVFPEFCVSKAPDELESIVTPSHWRPIDFLRNEHADILFDKKIAIRQDNFDEVGNPVNGVDFYRK